jgi:hypothetical protein
MLPWTARQPSVAELCARAMLSPGGGLRYVFGNSCTVRCDFEARAMSDTSVAYRVEGDGVEMWGTVALSAPEAGHLSTAFAPGLPPVREAFSSLHELFAKLAAIFNAYRLRIRCVLSNFLSNSK